MTCGSSARCTSRSCCATRATAGHLDPGTGEQLWWVHGFTGGLVVVVYDRGTIARYDEGVWEQMPTIRWRSPSTVSARKALTIWAVGGPYALADMGQPGPGPENEPRRDILLHYDGTAWTQVTLPELPERSVAAQSFFKVWGPGQTTCLSSAAAGSSSTTTVPVGGSDTGPGSQLLFTATGRGPDDVGLSVAAPPLCSFTTTVRPGPRSICPPSARRSFRGSGRRRDRPVYVSGFNGFLAELNEDEWKVADLFTVRPLHAVLGTRAAGHGRRREHHDRLTELPRDPRGGQSRGRPFTLTPTADVVEDTTQDTSAC